MYWDRWPTRIPQIRLCLQYFCLFHFFQTHSQKHSTHPLPLKPSTQRSSPVMWWQCVRWGGSLREEEASCCPERLVPGRNVYRVQCLWSRPLNHFLHTVRELLHCHIGEAIRCGYSSTTFHKSLDRGCDKVHKSHGFRVLWLIPWTSLRTEQDSL